MPTAQEYIVQNRWTALRSFYPTNNPWSSSLFLYLNDPVLVLSTGGAPSKSTASEGAPSAAATFHSGGGDAREDRDGSGGGGSSSMYSSTSEGEGRASWFSLSTSTLASPAWYCLGKVEAASSAVARIFLAGSSSSSSSSPSVFEEYDGGDGTSSNSRSGGGGGGGAEGSRKGDAGTDAGSGAGGEKEERRRLFLEFYGPIVAAFVALGLPAWLAELLTVIAAQLCPLLCAMPLLRLSSRAVVGAGTAGMWVVWGVWGVCGVCGVCGVWWGVSSSRRREAPCDRSLDQLIVLGRLVSCRVVLSSWFSSPFSFLFIYLFFSRRSSTVLCCSLHYT